MIDNVLAKVNERICRTDYGWDSVLMLRRLSARTFLIFLLIRFDECCLSRNVPRNWLAMEAIKSLVPLKQQEPVVVTISALT
jgi:hypothetical protein